MGHPLLIPILWGLQLWCHPSTPGEDTQPSRAGQTPIAQEAGEPFVKQQAWIPPETAASLRLSPQAPGRTPPEGDTNQALSSGRFPPPTTPQRKAGLSGNTAITKQSWEK